MVFRDEALKSRLSGMIRNSGKSRTFEPSTKMSVHNQSFEGGAGKKDESRFEKDSASKSFSIRKGPSQSREGSAYRG